MMYMVTYILLFFVLVGLPLDPGLRMCAAQDPVVVCHYCVQWKTLVVSLFYIIMYHGAPPALSCLWCGILEGASIRKVYKKQTLGSWCESGI